MTPKKQRLIFLLVGLLLLSVAVSLVLSAFRDNLVFFYSPTDIKTNPPALEKAVRIGGLVEAGSIQGVRGKHSTFFVTELRNKIAVSYEGEIPSLFREGQGVVAEGHLQADNQFKATRVLAKHDEKYMPPEVVKALKASGQWKDDKITPDKVTK